MKKPFSQAPARLQRLMRRLQKYQVEIVYKPGKEMHIADALSRTYLPVSGKGTLEDEIELHVHMLLSNLPISVSKLEEIKFETGKDAVMQ
ncbi:hypothetical protein HOLleu_40168 [Holothuria leucospilota]|uniref:Uncharacterized protein n=1 Tax=Holothuria leucospilota TaxID=206669 RepID=A0A9Q0YFQ1_HOLLE|nr:hypothetical protein HOLleu_40168 [Holothuria leucospilota]